MRATRTPWLATVSWLVVSSGSTGLLIATGSIASVRAASVLVIKGLVFLSPQRPQQGPPPRTQQLPRQERQQQARRPPLVVTLPQLLDTVLSRVVGTRSTAGPTATMASVYATLATVQRTE